MPAKINHLSAATRATQGVRSVRTVIHSQLAEVYLALTKDLTEESRSNALSLLNASMRLVRQIDESVEYIELAHKGIDGDLRDVSAMLRDMRYNGIEYKERSTSVDEPTPSY